MRRAGVQERGEHDVRIDVALLSGTNDAGEGLLGVGASPGPVAATHFTRHDRQPNRVFRAPVSGVDRGVKEERPDRVEFPLEMRLEPLDIGDAADVIQARGEAHDQLLLARESRPSRLAAASLH